MAGLLFALGLGLAGMTRPSKILAFLGIGPGWDGSLLLVMAGGIAVYAVAYRFIVRRKAPLLESAFAIPAHSPIGARLLVGAAIFGVGWGLAGFCPGPAIVAAGHGSAQAAVFVVAMFIGMGLVTAYERIAKMASSTASNLSSNSSKV
jgi:uncharacterized membrane protein YedE/YeeE